MSTDDVVELVTDAILTAAQLEGERMTTGRARNFAMAALIAMDLVVDNKNREHG